MAEFGGRSYESAITSSTHHKPKTILEIDVTNSAKSSEKPFHLLLAGLIGQPPNINATHFPAREQLAFNSKFK